MVTVPANEYAAYLGVSTRDVIAAACRTAGVNIELDVPNRTWHLCFRDLPSEVDMCALATVYHHHGGPDDRPSRRRVRRANKAPRREP